MNKLLLIFVLALASCSWQEKKEEPLVFLPAEPIIIHPPPPNAIELKSVKFYVVSEKNLDKFLEEVKASDGVFYAITPSGYENMSYNIQELRRYVKELQTVLLFYRKTYDKPTIENQ